jgi:hypothetical protein
MLPQLFFYLWTRKAGKYTLGTKFSGPTQRRCRGGLGEGGVGANPKPSWKGKRREVARSVRGGCLGGNPRLPTFLLTWGATVGGRGGGLQGGQVGSMHHPHFWVPPQILFKIPSFLHISLRF